MRINQGQSTIRNTGSVGQTAATPATQHTPSTENANQTAVPDAQKAIPRETAKEFAQSTTQPKSGQNVLSTRITHAQSQMGMNEQAWRDYGKAEKKLDQATKDFAANLDRLDRKDVMAEHEAFKEYARANASLRAYVENSGGSIWKLEAAASAQEAVEARIKFLQDGAEVPGGSKAKIPDTAPQQEMNMLIRESFETSRTQLDDLRQKIEPQLDDVQLNMFRDTEKAFDRFRDATAERSANFEARGGSLAPAIWGSVAEALTDKHIAELQGFLESVRSGA